MSDKTHAIEEGPPLSRSPVFENPYIKTGEPLTTIVAPVHTSDANYVRCIRPSQGTTSALISQFWKKLVNELAKRNISTVADSTEFERFVLNYHIISHEEYERFSYALDSVGRDANSGVNPSGGGRLPDSSADGNLPATVSPDATKGQGSPRDDAKSVTSKPADVQSGSREKGGRGRKGKEG